MESPWEGDIEPLGSIVRSKLTVYLMVITLFELTLHTVTGSRCEGVGRETGVGYVLVVSHRMWLQTDSSRIDVRCDIVMRCRGNDSDLAHSLFVMPSQYSIGVGGCTGDHVSHRHYRENITR